MKLNIYKNYRTCPICGKSLPLTREYFKRRLSNGSDIYHKKCRDCEDKEKFAIEWKDGKLLCHSCNQYKDIDCFSANGSKSKIRNGRRTVCRDCAAKRQRVHDINLSDTKKLRKCLNFRFLGAKDRAQKANIPFNITLNYIEQLWVFQKGKCALSGLDMTYELKKGRIPTNVSIDKIDKDKGYTIGNIQLVCMACNQIKSDLSDKEMYNFCKKIIEHYENKNKENTSAA